MKKNLLLTGLLALALGALSSCGSDDEAALTEETNTVTFTLSPEKAVNTRALGANGVTTRADEQYYLRYKMSVYNAGTQTKITDAVKTTTSFNSNISFSVTLPKGTAYTCVFWADVVTDPSGMTDLYYNTSDMKTITFTDAAGREDANTEMLMAFQDRATIDAAGQASDVLLSMGYAVAQLNIKTTATMTGVNRMSVACGNIAMNINALTGKVTQSDTEVIYLTSVSQASATPGSPVNLISIYLLAPEEGMTLDAVTLGMIMANGNIVKSIEIPNVPLKRCYRTNITGDLSVSQSNSFGVSMDQSFDGEVTIDPDKVVKLGTYYYMDGTWSNTLDEDKEVLGIVFYAGRHPLDTDDYKDLNDNEMTDIHGYAIITDDAASPLAWGPTDIRCGTSASFFDWCGYSDQQQIIATARATSGKTLEDWPAVNVCVENNANVPDGFKLSSGLFLPSYAQMKYVYDNRDAIEAILEKVDGEPFSVNYGDFYLTSGENDTDVSKTSLISFSIGSNIVTSKDQKSLLRPILVF